MARSFRHSPFHGHCAVSDKFSKAHSHRAIRVRVRVQLSKKATVCPDCVLPLEREIMSIRQFPKDGKGCLISFDATAPEYIVRRRTNQGRLIYIGIDRESPAVRLMPK